MHFLFDAPHGFWSCVLVSFVWTTVALLILAAAIHALQLFGAAGRAISSWFTIAPGLDLVVTLFTVAPMFVGPIVWGWGGFVGGVAGQYAALLLWTFAHELVHFKKRRGPKIYKVNNKIVGTVRNLSACFLTSLAVPCFWAVRVAELFVYPAVAAVGGLPKYDSKEWVTVSRQKFSGLVGHDLIWCLYCDWMTGIWSLGSEMLRNVESFWCPIQFTDKAKCENCALDFPDVKHGWTPATGDIAEVAALVERKYLTEQPPSNAWFGHPVRLTVKGREPDVS